MDDSGRTVEERDRRVVVDDANNVDRREVVTTPTRTAATADSRIVARRVVWYIAGFIIALLALRIILLLLGANRGSGFVDFIYALSGVFAAPFAGIFPAPTYGQFFFDTASVIAIIVYALIAWGLARLFTLNTPTRVDGV